MDTWSVPETSAHFQPPSPSWPRKYSPPRFATHRFAPVCPLIFEHQLTKSRLISQWLKRRFVTCMTQCAWWIQTISSWEQEEFKSSPLEAGIATRSWIPHRKPSTRLIIGFMYKLCFEEYVCGVLDIFCGSIPPWDRLDLASLTMVRGKPTYCS